VPVVTQKLSLTPRHVSGIIPEAGTAMALVIPGITSTNISALLAASISSCARPNTNGSPPFSRTTWLYDFAYSIITHLSNYHITKASIIMEVNHGWEFTGGTNCLILIFLKMFAAFVWKQGQVSYMQPHGNRLSLKA
jgi:hypothetical protein